MAKKAYRVRNWKEYNKILKHRGNITLWIDEKSIARWYEKTHPKKRGRPLKYSDMAIQVMLILKSVYHLKLRSCQGFVESLVSLLKLGLDVPCYTQVSRRQNRIQLPLLPTLSQPIHMVLDASGLKLFGEGEWKVRQHGWTKHRMWRKLHIGVDEKSQLIVSAALTGNDCGDDKKLPTLLENYRGAIYQVSADGAYDSHACHDAIHKRGAKGTIPPQPNPKHKRKRKEALRRPRDEVVWQVQTLGREAWKQTSGYHRRSLAETAFYRYKQLLNDKLMARTLENQQTEAWIGCHILNKMTLMGRPISVPI
jgi:hypothetical protein